MKVIGIVGGSGAGKTTVLGVLSALDVETLDCDAIYHALLMQSEPLREALCCRFGDVFGEQGLNRQKLGEIVFQDPTALADLNEITQKYIVAELRSRIALARQQGRRGVAIDGATLLESPIAGDCDALVAVVAPEEVRLRRIMTREGISEDYARKRLSAQHSEAWLRERCGYVLENSGSVADLQEKARALVNQLLSNEANHKRQETENNE